MPSISQRVCYWAISSSNLGVISLIMKIIGWILLLHFLHVLLLLHCDWVNKHRWWLRDWTLLRLDPWRFSHYHIPLCLRYRPWCKYVLLGVFLHGRQCQTLSRYGISAPSPIWAHLIIADSLQLVLFLEVFSIGVHFDFEVPGRVYTSCGSVISWLGEHVLWVLDAWHQRELTVVEVFVGAKVVFVKGFFDRRHVTVHLEVVFDFELLVEHIFISLLHLLLIRVKIFVHLLILLCLQLRLTFIKSWSIIELFKMIPLL